MTYQLSYLDCEQGERRFIVFCVRINLLLTNLLARRILFNQRTDKYFDIGINGTFKRISIDKLNPSFILKDEMDTSQPPFTTTELSPMISSDNQPILQTISRDTSKNESVRTVRSERSVRLPSKLNYYEF